MQVGIAWQVKDIHDKLRHSITPNPQENRLSILNQEQSVSLEPFTGERQRWREYDARIANSTSLNDLA